MTCARIRSYLRLPLLLMIVLATTLFFATTPSASAAGTIGNDYGPWYPTPSSSHPQLSLYQDDVQLFGSAGVADIGDFTCTYPSTAAVEAYQKQGTAISSSDQAILGGIFADATAVYNGNLTYNGSNKSTYASGSAGMLAFLNDTKALLAAGGYVRFSTSSAQTTSTVDISSLHAQWVKSSGQYQTFQNGITAAQKQITADESAIGDDTTQATKAFAAIKKIIKDNPDLGSFQIQIAGGLKTVQLSELEAAPADLPPGMSVTGANPKSAGYATLMGNFTYLNNLAKDESSRNSDINTQKGTISNVITFELPNLQSVSGIGPEPALASLIDTNPAQVNVPLNLAYAVPQGCGLNPIDTQGLNFIQIITDPGTFFTDLILYIPQHAASESYNFLQPYAFLYTFWTPHTERGDTIFNVATSCPPVSKNNPESPSAQAIQQDSCSSSNQPLGFNQKNEQAQNLQTHMPWYLSIAIFLQWLISGFYFVILFAAAVLHMMRGDRRTQMSVLTLIPKLIVSILLTIFAPTIIGGLIDFSNTFVSSIFSLDSARSVGRITDILAQSNTYLTGAGTLITQLVQVVVGLFTDFFFVVFILGSLVRQLVLIVLVILAPLACFCIMIPRWQPQFARYVRVLMACIFLPTVMAFILKVGITVNPIVSAAANGDTVSGVTGLIGLALVMLTLWAMAKAMKLTAAIATGNSSFNNSLSGRAMGRLGEAASAAGMAGVFGAGALGSALGAGAAVGAASEGLGASLIPSGKGLTGGAASGILTGAARRLGLPASGGSSFAGADEGAGAGAGAGGLGDRYQGLLDRRMAERGEQRIPQSQAQAYKKTLAGAVSAQEQEMGRRMSRGERDEFMNGAFVRDGAGNIIVDHASGGPQRADGGFTGVNGRLIERKGNSYLSNPAAATPKRPAGAIGQAAAAAKSQLGDVAKTPIGGAVGRAGDRVTSAAQVAAAAAQTRSLHVRPGDASLVGTGDEGPSSADMTAHFAERARARNAGPTTPAPAPTPARPSRRRTRVSSPLEDDSRRER